MSYAFISYNRKNHDYAHQLANALRQRGFDVWFDDQIDYGDNWERTIFQVIDGCQAFIVLMSPESYLSDWVQRECHYAEKRQKPAFPLLLAGEEFPRYGLIQYVDVSSGSLPPADFYERLARVLPRKNADEGKLLKDEPNPATAPEFDPESKSPRSLSPFLLTSHRIITPAIQDCLNRIANPNTLPVDRAGAGQELNAIHDPRRGTGLRMDGIPDIDWLKIPQGEFIYQQGEKRTLPTYYIARYPVTFEQFQAFIDDPAGFANDGWWQDLALRQSSPGNQSFRLNNHPRENVSWYDAVAFCRWLSAKLKYIVRLSTDAEWEKAARGIAGRLYPWGHEYESGCANLNETTAGGTGSFMFQTTAVGVFAHAASPYGVLDMAGNVWEWCANLYDNPNDDDIEGIGPRILRGGSWHNAQKSGQTSFRASGDADGRTNLVGFRVARSIR